MRDDERRDERREGRDMESWKTQNEEKRLEREEERGAKTLAAGPSFNNNDYLRPRNIDVDV